MTTTFMERMADEARKRRLKVVELRGKGLTFEEIGGVLHLTRQRAWRLWKDAERKGEGA